MSFRPSSLWRAGLLGIAVVLLGFAPSRQEVLDEISNSLRAGNATVLSDYFANELDLKIKEKRGSYSSSKAQELVSDFLKNHPPISFKLIHQGSSKGSAHYGIGTLTTEDGSSFRTYIYVTQNSDGNYQIEELKFETQ